MVRRYYNLPSLTALAAFEASARHMDIKLAASELNVTPGAVSRQVRSLEEEAGTPLFHKSTDGLRLTPEGEDLYTSLARGFSQASEAFHRVRTGHAHDNVMLACSTAFGALWLMPKIGQFWRANPDIYVDHLISDVARDYRRAEVGLRIRYGGGAWPDEVSHRLFEDRILPICGPGFYTQIANIRPEEIPTLNLLHVEGVDSEWTNWEEFLRRARIPHGPLLSRRFNNFSVLLQATQDDQGVALGWERLIKPMLNDGRLMKLGDLSIEAPGAYYLTWNENHTLSPAAEALKSWLIETTTKEA